MRAQAEKRLLHNDMIDDAVGCLRQSDSAPRTRINAVAMQPIVVRGAVLGGLPDPRGDGAAWSGRGLSMYARAGASFDRGRFHAVFAPDLWYAQNKPFDIFASSDSTRSPYASSLYEPPFSIDLPSRFGSVSTTQISLGESAVWGSFASFDAGVSMSSQRWGPGAGGTLTLSGDSPGVPRLFARTNQPVVTNVGAFSFATFVGTLSESRFFDRNPNNDLRTLIGIAIAWSPSDWSPFAAAITHAHLRSGSVFPGSASNQAVRGPSDQINGLSLRFRDGRGLMRAWAEVARAGALPTFREFLTLPYQGVAFDVGVERAIEVRTGTVLLAGEAANLEQPTDFRGEASHDFYTSVRIAQGWTQRGQLLGYATGPGSQTQRLSADWIGSRASAGLFGERVRWNEDAFLRQFLPYPVRHDVTVRAGIRGGLVAYGHELAVELATGTRLNYLFQNADYIPGYRTVDVRVPSLRFTFAPVARQSR